MIDGKNELDSALPFPKFKHWNKYAQIVFIGLLAGAGLFGVYAVFIGSMNMIESPARLSDIQINPKYPLYAESVYYKGDMKSEMYIYNKADWNAKNVWIGTELQYQAYKNGVLVMGVKNLFNGPFESPHSIKYTLPLKMYMSTQKYPNALSDIVDEYSIVIVVDGKESFYTVSMNGDKEDMVVSIHEV